MKLTIQIPDDLYDRYAELAQAAGVKPETFLGRTLLHVVSVADPRERALLIPSGVRAVLEQLLQVGQLKDGAQLVDKVSALARLHIGDVEIPLTAAMHEELRRKAIANDMSYEAYAQRIFRQIAEQFRLEF